MPDVAYVLPEYPVASQTFVHAELVALRAAGVDVEVLAHRRGAESIRFGDGPDGEPLPLALEGLDGPDFARRLRRYGHVHTHFADFAVRALAPRVASSGCRWSFTAHAYDIFRYDAAVTPAEWRSLPAGCRRVVTISRFHARFIAARGVDPERIVVVPNAARLEDLYARAPTAPERLRRILAVGRPVPKKGFGYLVQAFAQVRSSVPDLELTIIGGEGAMSDPPDGVRLTPMLPYAEVLERMAQSDLVVAPSVVAPDGDMDGIPTVLVEACALRRCVVASDVTGISDLVMDGVNGLLVPPGDVDALASALRRLATRPAELLRMATGGPVLAAAHDARRVASRLAAEVFAS